MVKLLTRPTGSDLTAVADDPAVVAAGQIVDELAARDGALRRELQEIDFLSNPNTASTDHRPLLSDAELIALHDRRVEVLRALRAIPGVLEAATAALVEARRRAVDTRRAACRARVAEKLQLFYRDLERMAAGSHRALVDEIRAMNDVLAIPGQAPAFPEHPLVWPELLPDSFLAHRQRELAADGWL